MLGPTSGFTTSDSLENAGDELFVAVVATTPYAPASLVSGFGVTWTRRQAQCSSRNSGGGVEIWTARNPAGNGPVSVTLSYETSNAAFVLLRYTNVDALSPVGASSSSNTSGQGGACTASNPALDSASYRVSLSGLAYSSRVVSAVASRGASHGAGNGFVEIEEASAGQADAVASVAVQDRVVLTPSVDAEGALGGAADWAAAAVEIRGP